MHNIFFFFFSPLSVIFFELCLRIEGDADAILFFFFFLSAMVAAFCSHVMIDRWDVTLMDGWESQSFHDIFLFHCKVVSGV